MGANKNRTSLTFKCIEDVEFIYPETKSAVLGYLSTLDSDEGAMSSKQSRVWDLFKIVKNALWSINVSKITRKTVFDILTSDWTKTGTMMELNRFLDFCVSHDLIADSDLIYIIKIKTDFCLTKKAYVELLQAPDVSKYFVRKRKTDNCADLLFVNVQNIEMRKVVQEYAMQSTFRGSQFNTFLNEFDNSLGSLDIQNPYELSLDTFYQQIDFFCKFENDVNRLLSYVNGFYMYMAVNYNPKIFESDGIDSRLLQRAGVAHHIADGYRIVKLNPIEDVPVADKWMLYFDADKFGNSNVKTSNSLLLDFTSIECVTYRNWVKHYMWKSHQDLYTRTHCMHSAKLFFNYIYALKTGKELSMYSKPTTDEAISVNEVVAYKNYVLRIYDNNRTRNSNIYNPRQILGHLRDNNITEIPNGVFYYLTHELDSNYDNRKAIPDDELKKIATVLKEKAETRLDFALAHLAFYIGLETEFRSSQIFSLKKDCVVETAKKGEYCIVSKTKTSAGETVEQPITIYVKRHIDEILKLTENIRKDAADGINDYLFISHGSKLGTYKIYGVGSFNVQLQECCAEAGVQPYAYSNLRYTHMTKSEEYIIRNQLSDMEQNILSGHKSPNTDNKHYIDTSIVELLESVHGVVIGNVDVDGKIKESLPEDIQNTGNSVSNNCGYCGCKQCTDYSFLDCMMCKDFVTTIDRLPYFQEQVKILDEKIKNTSIPHDKEDLVNIKRLHLGFISKILELKKQKGENINAQ